MKTSILLLSAALGLAALTPATRGHSYDLYAATILRFSPEFGAALTVRANPGDFPSGGNRRAALIDAVGRWNDNPSEFQFTLTYHTDTGFGNGQSDIWFTGDDYWLSGRPAVCYGWGLFVGGVWNLQEADILVDEDQSWGFSDQVTDSYAYGIDSGNHRSLQPVLMHELGHALGLNHEDRYYNIMGEEWDCVGAYNGQVSFTAGEDACSGTVVMYGLDGSAVREDVGVTHWKYGSADSEGYSSHFRCGVFTDDGSMVRAVPGTGAAVGYGRSDPIYEVQKGRTIKVELTFENNGYSGSVSPRVSYYLSSDDTIDGSDTVLATPRPTLNRNTPFTRTQDLDLPATLTSGANYFILVHVDDLNEIAEVNGNNNKTYVRLRIK